jgi:predicted DNA-binding transcriptional regulator AlpA
MIVFDGYCMGRMKSLEYLDQVAAIVSGRSLIRRAIAEHLAHGGNSISNGMMSGTICDGDADCSDATGADSAPAAADDDDGGDPDPEPARRQPSNTHPQAIAPTPARASERGTATATAGKSSPRIDPESELWRLPAVLAHVPISRSSWFAGVRSGRYPKPVRLSERRVAWRASDIRSFVAAL